MKSQSSGPILCALFVDYDNIYLSLKRKNEEAARRFAKDAGLWLKAIESGQLTTATAAGGEMGPRRIVLNRCYGNPVPRRNQSDNSTDMNSFPFVRHHFLRSGFEVIDCPPLTAQLKNSADIRMVMDVRDMLGHETRFEEFILLSGDADFTPLLHRLRAHARRTVVFANDHTAAPYTALSDGEVREQDLIQILMEGRAPAEAEPNNAPAPLPTQADIETTRRAIVAEVVTAVRTSSQPLPLEALADRAVRLIGHERTVGTGWGGAGSFRDLLLKALPNDVRLSDQPPFFVYDASRALASPAPVPAEPRREARYEPQREPRLDASQVAQRLSVSAAAAQAPDEQRIGERPLPAAQGPATQPQTVSMGGLSAPAPLTPAPLTPSPAPALQAEAAQPAPPQQQIPASRTRAPASGAIQQSIARIHEACQAPPLPPPEYRVLFEVMAAEINANSLSGSQTLVNIQNRARDLGMEVKRDDIRFVLEVVSEPDPWFEQGASASLFASRFRNFVVARCRSQGLQLSVDELDLIEAWFGGSPAAQRSATGAALRAPQQQPVPTPQQSSPQSSTAPAADRWWSLDEGRNAAAEGRGRAIGEEPLDDEFPRIVKNRLRG